MRAFSEEGRLRELLMGRALGESSREEEVELGSLGRGMQSTPDDYELAAAAVYLALDGAHEPLPEDLRLRLENSTPDILGRSSE